MIFSEETKRAAQKYAEREIWPNAYRGPIAWILPRIGPEGRKRIELATTRAAEQIIAGNPNVKPNRAEIVEAVKNDPEVKGFIPLIFILGAVISWAIGKFLDYLWDSRQQEQAAGIRIAGAL